MAIEGIDLLPFDDLDRTHLEACGNEDDFEAAIRHVTDVLDPVGRLQVMSAAAIVFGPNSTLKLKAGRKLVNRSVVETWPQLSPKERIEFVDKWLTVMKDKLSK